MELKKIRFQHGMTQKEVAAGIQCTPAVYSRYERGEREPSIETLLKLSSFFGVTVDYLLGNDNTMSEFSKYEIDLVMASRGADDRAKIDALNTLLMHQTKKEKHS